VVEAVRGIFEDPAYVAFRDPSPPQPLYTVRFIAREVWGAALPANVVEPPSTDTLGVDVFQPWLEMAARPPESANTNPDHSLPNVVVHAQTGSSCGKEHHDENTHAGGGHSHAGHSHQHGEDGEEHTHLPRAEVEQRAVEIEGGERPLQPLASALLAALETRGVVTRAALRAAVDTLDTARERGYGVTLVVRAWTDLAFKARLLADPAAAAAELGIQTSNYAAAAAAGDVSFHPGAVRRHAPGETVLRVVENTDEEHHLVVCTLCSCYPIAVLGMSPPWYKSRAYRARAVREPRSLLRDFGLELPAGVVLHVHDSTAEVRTLSHSTSLLPSLAPSLTHSLVVALTHSLSCYCHCDYVCHCLLVPLSLSFRQTAPFARPAE
jgi:nitrile hydratase subunit alpha